MASIRELIDALLVHRVIVRHDGEKVQLVAPLGDPVPTAIVTELKERKGELLAYLDWREAADDLLVACMNRLADVYPIGMRLDASAWRDASGAVTAAYHTGDLEALCGALVIYERFARAAFAADANDAKEARP